MDWTVFVPVQSGAVFMCKHTQITSRIILFPKLSFLYLCSAGSKGCSAKSSHFMLNPITIFPHLCRNTRSCRQDESWSCWRNCECIFYLRKKNCLLLFLELPKPRVVISFKLKSLGINFFEISGMGFFSTSRFKTSCCEEVVVQLLCATHWLEDLAQSLPDLQPHQDGLLFSARHHHHWC